MTVTSISSFRIPFSAQYTSSNLEINAKVLMIKSYNMSRVYRFIVSLISSFHWVSSGATPLFESSIRKHTQKKQEDTSVECQPPTCRQCRLYIEQVWTRLGGQSWGRGRGPCIGEALNGNPPPCKQND